VCLVVGWLTVVYLYSKMQNLSLLATILKMVKLIAL
jgi:hypothetical protein